MRNNMLFICAQPHDLYFQWQCEVLITNFREHNLSDKMHILVWYPQTGLDPGWKKLVGKYREVKFFFYKDEGVDFNLYIPQLRPHILKMHFKGRAEELKGKVIFYHDSDILFNYLPDFDYLCQGDINWQSDTSSYLDYTYLTQKEKQGAIPEGTVVNKLAEIGEIDPEVIKSYDRNTGGAQYILKDIDASFWEDVERMCLEIRKYLMVDINQKTFASESQGFQSWCADMWAVNFSLWKRGKKTQVTPFLDFSWATDSLETYQKKPIFHNAGATPQNKVLFFKGAWINRSPIGAKIVGVSKLFASSKYVEAIAKVK